LLWRGPLNRADELCGVLVSNVSVQIGRNGATAADPILSARLLLRTPVQQASGIKPAQKISARYSAGAEKTSPRNSRNHIGYLVLCVLLTVAGILAVWAGNRTYAPEMYAEDGMAGPAAALAGGRNYALFDLNVNIRNLRHEHIARLTQTPDLVLVGASHWQEANAELVPHLKMYNAHLHRDYWEGPLAVTEMLVEHDRLPKKMIISIRDNQFTPVSARKDFLWEPDIPFYRAMADRLHIEADAIWLTLPFNRMREMLSLSMLFKNFTHWQNAEERPHATGEKHFESLDVLLPDGSIVWSNQHMRLFTPGRSKAESLKFAALNANSPPVIDPRGVTAFDELLTYLKARGVTVYLVNPPFNPIYFDKMQGTPYAAGLRNVEALTARFAATHGLQVIGSFNPHKVGCDSTMYIDAEHANAKCLRKIFDQFAALDRARGAK
jgi:hypothetical protein